MSMTKRFLAVCLIALSAVAVSSGVAMARIVVKATNGNAWNPPSATVGFMGEGISVRWKNPTGRTHVVKSTSDNWSKNSTIGPGEGTSATFRSVGTYRYKCTIHVDMKGKIILSK